MLVLSAALAAYHVALLHLNMAKNWGLLKSARITGPAGPRSLRRRRLLWIYSPIDEQRTSGAAVPLDRHPGAAAPGTTQTYALPGGARRYIAIRAVDDQGNLGCPATVDLGYPPPDALKPAARLAGWIDAPPAAARVHGRFLDVVFYTAITPLLPDYVDDLGLSKAAAGVLSASYAAGTLAASLPAGLMAARVGPRRTMVAGLLLLGVASLVFGFGRTWCCSTPPASSRGWRAPWPGPER